MMTQEQLQELCPKAERITITDGTVAMKVGEFSQAINVDLSKDHEQVQRQVKNLYLDLQAMNREQQSQIEAAQRAR
jgi:DNA-binding ferritin-like protein